MLDFQPSRIFIMAHLFRIIPYTSTHFSTNVLYNNLTQPLSSTLAPLQGNETIVFCIFLTLFLLV